MSTIINSTAPRLKDDGQPTSRQQTLKKTVVTPGVAALQEASLKQRMSVDKNIVDELLLVCGVIGTTVDEKDELVPVTDCLNWLQDLQRALRRDDDLYRPVSLLLGQWKIVEQKLMPLILHARYDSILVQTVCKILVILTKPLAENTVRAGKMVIDAKSRKTPESVIKEQMKLRENALQQAQTLLDYKRAFCQHPSHRYSNDSQQGGLLSILVSLLAEPLSRTGNARTDADHLTIELVLHLLRNLLAAEPLLNNSLTESLHHEMIVLFDRELVLELLLVLAADIEQRENAQYNLLLMELLHHLIRNQDPFTVAKSMKQQQQQYQNPKADVAKENRTGNVRNKMKVTGILSDQLRREKAVKVAHATSRHSQFVGTLVWNRPDGRRQYMSATTLSRTSTQSQPKRHKNKKLEPFTGASYRGSINRSAPVAGSPAALRAAKTLHNFCIRFVESCYGPVMKSLKNEFRRDSVRLEDGDRVVFFQLAWFFCQWWRLAGGNTKLGIQSDNSSIGQLIFTMDIFTFNLVFNATDTFTQHKKYAALAHSVALLSEMLHLLNVMYMSNESTEQIMALGLMDRLFYSSEPLDRLPKLMAQWIPATFTREYLCDLVEICHLTLKLLDANVNSGKKEIDENNKHDTVVKMKAVAAQFDVSAYFARKLVSNHMVSMYTQLLTKYDVNSLTVNHRVVAYFLRLCKHKLSLSASDDSVEATKNPLAHKEATFQPMLYNIHMLTVLSTILNDKSIHKDKEYASLLQFSLTIVHDFAVSVRSNPVLFIEVLFAHPLPHRFCEAVMNMYVTDDLRMMVERDRLLSEQQQLEQETAAILTENNDDDENTSSDEELEFMGMPLNTKNASRQLVDSDEEEDEDDVKPAAKRKAGSISSNGSSPVSNKKLSRMEDSDDDDDNDDIDDADRLLSSINQRQKELERQLQEFNDEDDAFTSSEINESDVNLSHGESKINS